MEIKQWEKWLTIFDEDVAVFAMGAVLVAVAVGGLILFPLVLGVLSVYIILTAARVEWYRYRSQRLGLKFFYLVPTGFIPLIFRKKLAIPASSSVIWRIHVNQRNFRKMVSSGKKGILRCRQEDIDLIANSTWRENEYMIGSTYAALGKIKASNIEKSEYDFPLFRFHKWLKSNSGILAEQKKYFGAVYTSPSEIRWKTFTFKIK